MEDQSRQRIKLNGKIYTRTVRHIFYRPDGLADRPHGLVRINGEGLIVKLQAEGFHFDYDNPDHTPTWRLP